MTIRKDETARDELERRLGAWLGSLGDAPEPDLLAAVLRNSEHSRQRPAWTFPAHWLSRAAAGAPLSRRTGLALVALAIIAGLVVAALAGALLSPKQPFGGGSIAFSSTDGIWLTKPDGTGTTLLLADPTIDRVQWAPDGKSLAIRRHTGRTLFGSVVVSVVDLSGRVVDLSPPMDRPDAGGAISWTPDSMRVVFAGETAESLDVVIAKADGSGVTGRSSWTDDDISSLAVTADATRVLVSAGRPASNHLYVMAIEGGDRRRMSGDLLDPAGSFDLSADGRSVAYCTYDFKTHGDIRTLAIDGSSARSVATGPEDDCYPRWSPDGTRIAWWREPDELVVASADGTAPRVVAHASTSWNSDLYLSGTCNWPLLTWSPDGQWITSSDERRGTLIVADALGTGQAREITRSDSGSLLCVDWSTKD